MGEVITAKRQAFKAWKTGKGTRASYYAAKRIARRAVHHARQEADMEVYKQGWAVETTPGFNQWF